MMRRILCVLCLFLLDCRAQNEDEEARRARLSYLERISVEAAPVHTIEAKGSADAALAIYRQHASSLDRNAMGKIYKAAGSGAKAFKTVAWLINTKQISAEHSILMAQLREAMIEEMICEIGSEKGWKIARSDSGNVSAGMKSDLDQTFYVFENGERNPELDQTFIDEFNRRWQDRHGASGLSLEALDIASIEGRNRFPDVRVTEAEGFWTENRRTHDALRNTPGAYTYGGAVGHQMQLRALASILANNPRAFRIYDADENGRGWERKELPSDAERLTTEGRRRLREWTDEAVRTMFGKRPELRPVWAFDAALANFLELQHYMHEEKFETKYHLRTFEDSVLSQWLSDRGLGQKSKAELVDLGTNQRNRIYDVILARLIPGEGPKVDKARRLHRLALEISVAQRLHHKGGKSIPKIAAFRGRPPADPAEGRKLIFEEFGRELYGAEWRATSDQMQGARERYRRLASEFCLESAYHTSKEAFATLLDDGGGRHLDFDRFRKLLDIADDAEWARTKANLQDAAHLTFLYGIYDLGMAKSLELANRLRLEFGNRHVPRLLGLWTRGQLQLHAREWKGVFGEIINEKLPGISERVQNHVLSELGFERIHAIDGVHAKLRESKLIWDPGRLAKNMAYDPGNIDAIAEIVRVWAETDGDPDAVNRAIADEFLMAIPVLGQIIGATRGGVTGLAILGIARLYPPVGGVLIAVSVARAGIAVYDAKVARPIRNDVVDALYQGWSGPPSRRYPLAPPPEFSAKDRARLKQLEALMREPKWPFVRAYDAESARLIMEQIKAHQEAQLRAPAEIQTLRAKEALWKAHQRESRASYAGVQALQRPFPTSLLAPIEAIVAYSPKGIVDFEARQDPDELEALKQARDAAPEGPEHYQAEARWREASLQRDRQERAERYRARALGSGSSTAELAPREAPQGSLELRYSIKRDSLYPGLRKLGYESPDDYVNAWLKEHPELVHELGRQKLLVGQEVEWIPSIPHPIPRYKPLSRIPERILDDLRKRVRKDFERSRRLWETWRERERMRLLKGRQDLARRLASHEAGAASLVVSGLLNDSALRLAAAYEAMRQRDRVPAPPEVEVTLYRDANGLGVRSSVRADPASFRPPYTCELVGLDAKELRAAIASGRHRETPITPRAKAAMQRVLGNARDDDPRRFYLVNGFCASVDEESVRDLPQVSGRVLIAQSVFFEGGEKKPETAAPPEVAELGIHYYISHASIIEADQWRVKKSVERLFRNVPEPRLFHKPAERLPLVMPPRPVRINLDRLVRPGQERDLSRLKRLPTAMQNGTLVRYTIGNQTRYGFGRGMFSVSVGNLRFCGLKDGTHGVQVVGQAPDGTIFRDRFRIAVKLKSKSRYDEHRLPESRARWRQEPTRRNASFYDARIRGVIRTGLREYALDPATATKYLKEAEPLWEVLRADARKRGIDRLFQWESKLIDFLYQTTRDIGTRQAAKILEEQLRIAEPTILTRPPKRRPYQLHAGYKVLGDLIVGLGGNLSAARKHFQHALELQWAGKTIPKEQRLDAWWKALDFSKLKKEP